MYKAPNSKLIDSSEDNGCCPFCHNKATIASIAKPTILPNRIKCSYCGEKIKFSYGRVYFWVMQIVGFMVGGVSIFGGFVISFMVNGAIDKSIYTVSAFLYCIPIVIIFVSIIGVFDAVYCRPRYKLVPFKK